MRTDRIPFSRFYMLMTMWRHVADGPCNCHDRNVDLDGERHDPVPTYSRKRANHQIDDRRRRLLKAATDHRSGIEER